MRKQMQLNKETGRQLLIASLKDRMIEKVQVKTEKAHG